MDTEVSYNFDDIRPLNNNEVKDAIEALVTNEDFERAFRYIKPDVNWKEFSETMRSFKTKEDFKSKLAYEAVMLVANKTTFSLTISGRSRLPKDKKPCTFISNHRDIVLDASFLNVMLYDVGYGMTQVAIGDNLMIRPWIETLVRLNNSFYRETWCFRTSDAGCKPYIVCLYPSYDQRYERIDLDCTA